MFFQFSYEVLSNFSTISKILVIDSRFKDIEFFFRNLTTKEKTRKIYKISKQSWERIEETMKKYRAEIELLPSFVEKENRSFVKSIFNFHYRDEFNRECHTYNLDPEDILSKYDESLIKIFQEITEILKSDNINLSIKEVIQEDR